MKHIKTFEATAFIKDDYVVAKNKTDIHYNKTGKIIYAGINMKVVYDNSEPFWFKHDEVRRATQKEIEQYELEQSSNKYNI